jgi:probable rRNA maturation factor
MTGSINFFTENITYKLSRKRLLNAWIADAVNTEQVRLGNINIVLCDDSFLLRLNRKFLKKNSLTDIITFSFAEEKDELSGDIYISLPRVRENARQFRLHLVEELSRVIIHGVLHLAGYDDHSEDEKQEMRKREDFYLKRLRKLSE